MKKLPLTAKQAAARETGKRLVQELYDRSGSMQEASRRSGIHAELLRRWLHEEATPKSKSIDRLRISLEADDYRSRERRIIAYQKRAERRQPLFDG